MRLRGAWGEAEGEGWDGEGRENMVVKKRDVIEIEGLGTRGHFLRLLLPFLFLFGCVIEFITLFSRLVINSVINILLVAPVITIVVLNNVDIR